MKHLVLILYGLAFVSLSLLYSSCHLLQDSDSSLSYIRRVTRVSLPSHLSVISEFDQGEMVMGGKYQIEQKDIKGFLDSNAFHPIDKQYRYLSHFNAYSKEDKISLSDSSYLKYLYGCKQDNSWLFTLNEKTGELWVEVQYPDFGGQGPGCKF